jgi:outer membrane protein assembly factor BamE (lipoprotein component of BamABCDE complex)
MQMASSISKAMKISNVLMTTLALCAGCVTQGTKFDPSAADSLQPGISTTRDATQLLGPPSAESRFANGNTLLQWQYVTGTMVGGTGAHLAVLFDSNGRMIRTTHKWTQ